MASRWRSAICRGACRRRPASMPAPCRGCASPPIRRPSTKAWRGYWLRPKPLAWSALPSCGEFRAVSPATGGLPSAGRSSCEGTWHAIRDTARGLTDGRPQSGTAGGCVAVVAGAGDHRAADGAGDRPPGGPAAHLLPTLAGVLTPADPPAHRRGGGDVLEWPAARRCRVAAAPGAGAADAAAASPLGAPGDRRRHRLRRHGTRAAGREPAWAARRRARSLAPAPTSPLDELWRISARADAAGIKVEGGEQYRPVLNGP